MPDLFQSDKKESGSYWKDIWIRFKNGNIRAFELIYGEHVDFLYSYGTKMTSDTELVEDAVQDLFLYLLSRKDKLSVPDSLRFYLLKAFKRILLEKISKERLWMKDKDNSFPPFDYTIEFDSSSSFNEKEKKIELIEELVEQLDSRKKEVIFLRFYSGLSYDDIGNIVGIQPSSAKKMVYRTISSFREILKPKIVELFLLFNRSFP
ncbi:MAG: sigma-70 family RNA polymerase sigma factor [Prolixibacteraceae bacterium]|jgi:RNA polymerase sigma factor (sigma-70 family)|nr:sigma-70 family RNA polymerase sigma factor [Prolixibacteraceae bacterium]